MTRGSRETEFTASGLLLVDKPEGPTSAHVVARVKRLLGAGKVGHLGTLDPFASGLLPLGINEGTKVAEIFLAAQKSYRGVIALGVETDTQDVTGNVIASRPVPALGAAELEKLRQAFTGTSMQTPPMYSALKKDGVRLYDLARKGETVEREPRQISIETLHLWQEGTADIAFELTCSKGTYIRTLAADMGTFLGPGAHLKSLRRLSCGRLSVEQAIRLDDIESAKLRGEVPLLSLNHALSNVRAVSLDSRTLSSLRLGRQEVLSIIGLPKEDETMVRLLTPEGRLAALARWEEIVKRWRLFRTFAA
ncbi:MAG TPA: tRNA pseudouridine(55) synthase TruB [Verrucomicrobiae bacterium]|jgi:tRNA pseudouridine55 synthase|nr:tRNA pseudouridine(55) synthase TruB [Verrucomicrobiae bacterium]